VTQADAAARLVSLAASFRGEAGELLALLAEEQRGLCGARGVAILRAGVPSPDGARDVDVLAVSPPLGAGMPTPAWMERAAEMAGRVARGGRAEHDGGVVVAPLGSLVAAAALPDADDREADRVAGALSLGGAALRLFEARRALERERSDSLATRGAVRIVAGANEHEAFDAIGAALCNEVCAVLGAERVSLGLVKGRLVRLEAMSHAEKIVRATELSQVIAGAMDECVAQEEDIEAGPEGSPDGATFIARQATELARRESGLWASSLPVRVGAECIGALTIERRAASPLGESEREALRIALDLLGPRIREARRRDRWFGARSADEVRRWGAWAVGARNTWAKLAAIVMCGVLAFSLLFSGTDTATGPFVLRAEVRRVVPAPFDGYLAEVDARPGDAVAGDTTVLARLATSELELELAQVLAERATASRRAAIARSEGRIAEALVAEAGEREATARERLLRGRIEMAAVVSPIDGLVVSGDLRDRVGGAVERGESLFEVAQTERLRVDIFAPDDRVADLEPGMKGTLATVARPDRRIAFEVVSIDPAASDLEGQTVFRVVATLDDPGADPWLRPGMEGVARIEVGRARYAWLWARRTVNWVRMRLWL